MDEVADRLHPRPAGLGGAEEAPGEVEHAVALAEAAGEQEDQRLVGQLLDRVLAGVGDDRVGQAAVADHRVGGDAEGAGGGGEAAAPVAEAVAVAGAAAPAGRGG